MAYSGSGKFDREHCAGTKRAVDLDAAAKTLYCTMGKRETYPQAARFGGEEESDKPGQLFRRHTAARVGNANVTLPSACVTGPVMRPPGPDASMPFANSPYRTWPSSARSALTRADGTPPSTSQ